jgi:hypothetical protein
MKLLALSICFAGLIARADTVVLVTSQSALNPNDSVAWGQLGSDGTSIDSPFTATSGLGLSIGGSFASGTGTVCDPNVGGACNNYPFSDSNLDIWANNGSESGTGPLTLTFPGVSGVGTYMYNDVAAGTQFTAQLALYNGTSLLATFTESSDTSGDPIYLGAQDTSGAGITSAVFSLTVAGQSYGSPVGYNYSNAGYNCNAGHVDPPLCSSMTSSLCSVVVNTLKCPQKCECQFGAAAALSGVVESSLYPNWSGVVPLYNDVPDTNPSDLADFYIDSLDLSDTVNSTPEPETLHILAAMGVALAALLHRKFVRRPKGQDSALD